MTVRFLTPTFAVSSCEIIDAGGCIIREDCHTSLNKASELLGVSREHLQDALRYRVMQPQRGGRMGTVIKLVLHTVPFLQHFRSHFH